LETEEAHKAFRRVCADLPRLYDAPPEIIAADLHPDYLSTQFAMECRSPIRRVAPLGSEQRAGLETGAPHIVQVQHHVAHVLACIAENEIQLPALGVAWDGTGYGTDGTIWGGEFFLVTEDAVERVATLRPFPLPGGNAAVKEPRRPALGILFEVFGDAVFEKHELSSVAAFSAAELPLIKTMLKRELNSPKTSSVGRFFDAVASIANLRQQMRFEGQAAMELEFALDGIETGEGYSMPIVESCAMHPALLDWQPLIRELLADVDRGLSIGHISAKFHNALAEAIVAVARKSGQTRVALSGGCFQNRYLTERTVARLREEKFQPYWHQRVPTNDGGIALGQIVAASRQSAANSSKFGGFLPKAATNRKS
jgi:hydrogenase maturation protein HypF